MTSLLFGFAVLAATIMNSRFGLSIVLVSITLVKPVSLALGDELATIDDIGVLAFGLTIFFKSVINKKQLRTFPGFTWFVLFVFFGILSSVLNDQTPVVLFSGTYLATKGILLGLASSQIEWRERDILSAVKGIFVIGWIVSLAGILNLIFPQQWNFIFAKSRSVDYQLGFPSIVGPFTHPSEFAFFSAACALIGLSYYLFVERRKRVLALVGLAAFLGFATMRRKTWAAALISFSWILVRWKRSKGITAVIVLLAAFALVFGEFLAPIFEKSFLEYFQNWQLTPRIWLLAGSLEISFWYFPFGSGFGTYGTHVSASNYSEEYSKLGFEGIWGLGSEGVQFLTDTQWPAILGETGWLGLICFGMGIFAIIKATLNPAISESDFKRFLVSALASLASLLLVQSLAEPTFYAPPTYPWIFLIAAITTNIRSDLKFDASHRN